MTPASFAEINPRAMVNLADLDTTFLVPCKHCGELLEEKDRFCPRCGKDQSVADNAADAISDVEPGPLVEVGRVPGTPPGAQTAMPPYAMPPNRRALGIVAALVVLLALVFAYRHFDGVGPAEAGKPPAQPQPQPQPRQASGAPEAAALPAQVPMPPQAPPATIPPAETGAADSPEKECGEVLAALALCSKK